MEDSGKVEDSLVKGESMEMRKPSATLFNLHRHRLRRMVEIRLDRRFEDRLDPSDVLQEAFLDMTRELPQYSQKQNVPFFLWMRLVTGQRLMRLHRQHLGAEMRDASREISIHQNVIPQAASMSIAASLVANTTSASRAAIRAELQQKLKQALDGLQPLDQEIIALGREFWKN